MPPRTPFFWYDDTPAAARGLVAVLAPLSWLWRAGHALRQRRGRAYTSRLPVICVGNLVAGGGGKTPTALAIMALIREKQLARNPCFLTRGYGGREHGPVLADRARHDHHAVGDEALLLAATAPVIVGADRAAGAKLAEELGFDLIVMDDGLQNPGLAKTLRLVVIDGASGFGNERMIPAGPLRETLAAGLANADAFVLVGADARGLAARLPPKPLLRASMDIPAGWTPPAEKFVAFAGIARPEKFRAAAEALGLILAAWHPFPDHHVFTRRDLDMLARSSSAADAPLLTTAKDAARLPPDFNPPLGLHILPVILNWAMPAQAEALFASALPSLRA